MKTIQYTKIHYKSKKIKMIDVKYAFVCVHNFCCSRISKTFGKILDYGIFDCYST